MAKVANPQIIQMQNMGRAEMDSGAHNVQHDSYQPPPPFPRSSLIDVPNISDAKKSTMQHNGADHQLIPVEIEKDPELGLVIGKVEGDPWIFIDEILPNGMIDMHGVLKEGDYLVQVGVYSLIGVDVPTALLLIEKAYDEGRKSVSFTAARAEVTKGVKVERDTHFSEKKQPPEYTRSSVAQPMPPVGIPEKQSTPYSHRRSEGETPSREKRSISRRVVNSKEHNDDETTTQF